MLSDHSSFWRQTSFAVIGVSQNQRKFGRIIYDEMKRRGYPVVGVNPHPFEEDGITLFPRLAEIAPPPAAIIVVVPPEVTNGIVREAHELKIGHVWIQPGAESDEAITFCRESGINVIHGDCVLLHLQPVKFPHSMHRWFKKVF